MNARSDTTADTTGALDGHDLIVFGPDWGRHPSVSQHLFQRFVGKSRIVWVETVGMRTPTLTWRDAVRSLQKIRDFLGRRPTGTRVANPDAAGVTVLTPVTLPFTRWYAIRLFNLWQVRRAVARAVAKLDLRNYSVIATVPSQCDYVGRLGEARSLYYCIDDYGLWPGMDRSHVRAMEARLVKKVDALVVSSDALAASMAASGKPVHLLTHGVDAEHFSIGQVKRLRQPFEIAYFGLIDERTDQDLLIAVAAAVPNARIRLIGPVVTDVSRLAGLPNVRLEGQVSYAALPQAVSSVDLFVLPYQLTELAKSINPIKLKEYLACGRPVVATALPEVVKLGSHVAVAHSSAAFVAKVVLAAGGRLRFDRDAVQAFIAGETWLAKAERFGALLRSMGSAKPSLTIHAIPDSQNDVPRGSLVPQPSL